MSAVTVERELLDLERGFWQAANDPAFYRKHTAEDAMFLLPPGILDKRAILDAIGSSEEWTSFELHDLAQIRLGEGVAALCYRADANRAGVSYAAAIASTYRRASSGEWQLVIHQQTPIG